MKLLASIPALFCAAAFHVAGALAALPDHGLASAAGATGQTTASTAGATLVQVQWPAHSNAARTDYGTNRAQSASATANTVAYAGSLWWDRYTISGGTGTASAGLTAWLDGSLQTTGAAAAAVGYLLVISNTPLDSFDFDFSGLTTTNVPDWLDAQLAAAAPGSATVLVRFADTASGLANKTIDQTFARNFGFTYDTPFYVGAALLTGSGVGNGGAARADFFDTATLGFTLAAGDTLVMASSVPEPAAWVTLLVGLGLIGLRLRRRAQTGQLCPPRLPGAQKS